MLGVWTAAMASGAATMVFYLLLKLQGVLAATDWGPAPANPSNFQAFALLPPTDIPLHLFCQAPLTSVVTLVMQTTVIQYRGTQRIQSPQQDWSHSHEEITYGTGFIVEGNPTQIVTAGHNLWTLGPVIDAAHQEYTELMSTAIMAVPYQTFAGLTPEQKRNFCALQEAGGQFIQAFQTTYPTLQEQFDTLIRARGHLLCSSDAALLHLQEPFRRGAPGPHLHILPYPIVVQPSTQFILAMRGVVLGHAFPQHPPPGIPADCIFPRSSAFSITTAGFHLRASTFSVQGRLSAPGFSGGPLCIPPQAVITTGGLPVNEEVAPQRWRAVGMVIGAYPGTPGAIPPSPPRSVFLGINHYTITELSRRPLLRLEYPQVGHTFPWDEYLGLPPACRRPLYRRIPLHAAQLDPKDKTFDSQGPSVCTCPTAPLPARLTATRATAAPGPASTFRGGRGLPTFRRAVVAAPLAVQQGRQFELERDTAASEVLERLVPASRDGVWSPWQGILA